MSKVLLQNVLMTATAMGTVTRNLSLAGMGANGLQATEANALRTVRSPGVISRLSARVSVNASDNNTTFRIRKNGGNGNQLITFAAAETGIKIDAVNTDSFASGDTIGVQIINTGTGSITIVGASAVFDATTNTVNVYGFNAGSTSISSPLLTYEGLSDDGLNATVGNVYAKMGTAGTMKNMGVRLSANTLSGGGVSFTVYVNGVASTLVVSFGPAETGTKEDTVNTKAIAVDDLAAIEISNAAGSGTCTQQISWVEFETTNRKTDYISQQHSTRTVAQTRYFPFIGIQTANSTETNTQFYAQVAATLSNFRINVSANTWTSDTTSRFRINGANGNQVVTTATTVTGWQADGVNTDVISTLTDLINYQVITSAGSGSITIETMVMTAEMPAAAASTGSTLLMMGVG